MYDLWIAAVIGIVEGVTEFLPVSSTGHMILTNQWLGIPETDEAIKTFEIVIQLGAILAVALLYYRRILRLLGLERGPSVSRTGKRLSLVHIFLAIFPAMLLAFLFGDWIKEYLFSYRTVLIGLVAGGIFMIYAEKKAFFVRTHDMDEMTYKQALLIGMAQCLSLWPGFSRSGATIAGGMLAGASRKAAADFSFFIAIPVMFAATGYELLFSTHVFTREWLAFFATGFLVSFLVALLAVVTFLKLLQKLKLTHFAYYRFALAGAFWLFVIHS